MDFTFLIGKYAEKELIAQLAQALSATKLAANGGDVKKRAAAQRRGRAGVAVLMSALGAVMIYAAAIYRAVNIALYVPVGVAAILASIYLLVTLREADWRMEKPSAKQLLRSLNGIETGQCPRVQLRTDGVHITARSGEAHTAFSEIEAAAETKNLFVLRHGRSVTVLQKKDLVSGDPACVAEALCAALDCPYLNLK